MTSLKEGRMHPLACQALSRAGWSLVLSRCSDPLRASISSLVWLHHSKVKLATPPVVSRCYSVMILSISGPSPSWICVIFSERKVMVHRGDVFGALEVENSRPTLVIPRIA